MIVFPVWVLVSVVCAHVGCVGPISSQAIGRHNHLIGPVCVFANVCARQSYDDTKIKKKQSPDWSIQLRRGINIYILISELY